jgi:hypothetical protein
VYVFIERAYGLLIVLGFFDGGAGGGFVWDGGFIYGFHIASKQCDEVLVSSNRLVISH